MLHVNKAKLRGRVSQLHVTSVLILPDKKQNSLFSLCSMKTNDIICFGGNELY